MELLSPLSPFPPEQGGGWGGSATSLVRGETGNLVRNRMMVVVAIVVVVVVMMVVNKHINSYTNK